MIHIILSNISRSLLFITAAGLKLRQPGPGPSKEELLLNANLNRPKVWELNISSHILVVPTLISKKHAGNIKGIIIGPLVLGTDRGNCLHVHSASGTNAEDHQSRYLLTL